MPTVRGARWVCVCVCGVYLEGPYRRIANDDNLIYVWSATFEVAHSKLDAIHLRGVCLAFNTQNHIHIHTHFSSPAYSTSIASLSHCVAVVGSLNSWANLHCDETRHSTFTYTQISARHFPEYEYQTLAARAVRYISKQMICLMCSYGVSISVSIRRNDQFESSTTLSSKSFECWHTIYHI